ncbi:hypothetical protein [Streptomyces sp. NPDC048641]|uniref:hypothetical protein n=1 Tax=unclassified Streptomyces TaxID=2593676 RepID=UPI00343C9ED4
MVVKRGGPACAFADLDLAPDQVLQHLDKIACGLEDHAPCPSTMRQFTPLAVLVVIQQGSRKTLVSSHAVTVGAESRQHCLSSDQGFALNAVVRTVPALPHVEPPQL